MEDNFYNDGFEEFLQQQVKDTKMYPSDAIWRNVYKEVHGDTNWPGLTFAAFAFLAAIIFISVYFSPSPDIFKDLPATKAYITTKASGKPDHKKGDLVAAASLKRRGKLQPIPFIAADEEEITANVADQVAQNVTEVENTVESPQFTYSKPAKSIRSYAFTATPIVKPSRTVMVAPVVQTSGSLIVPVAADETPMLSDVENVKGIQVANEGAENINTDFENDYLTRPVNAHPGVAPFLTARNKNRFSYTVYIAASSSYRQLLENKTIYGDGKVGPLALNQVVDVNKVVRHKPGTGIEAGVNFMYSITDKLKVVSGLQFNIRQYSMSAYLAPAEVATIGLINRSGSVDSVGTYALYRNANGYLPTELVNRYYQVAVPIGLQWQVLGNRNIELHVAASVQPTYYLNRNAFLLSTDYKNYTQSPDIMRKWNVNSSLETFITYKSGDFKWQLGPQFRYQNLPTFISEYPIREYLIDYGVKLGVSKTIQ